MYCLYSILILELHGWPVSSAPLPPSEPWQVPRSSRDSGPPCPPPGQAAAAHVVRHLARAFVWAAAPCPRGQRDKKRMIQYIRAQLRVGLPDPSQEHPYLVAQHLMLFLCLERARGAGEDAPREIALAGVLPAAQQGLGVGHGGGGVAVAPERERVRCQFPERRGERAQVRRGVRLVWELLRLVGEVEQVRVLVRLVREVRREVVVVAAAASARLASACRTAPRPARTLCRTCCGDGTR